jgi:type II secretory pathway pseudopilin PulG
MQNRIPQRGALRAFTALEILIAFGVLTILLGLVFGIVSLARARARAAVCTSRRRQVMIATVQYATDYKMNAGAKVRPSTLLFGNYLPGIETCPGNAFYSIEKPGVFPRCSLHSKDAGR